MFISDLSHYEGADPESNPAAYRLAQRLGEISYAATSIPADRTLRSALPCNRRPHRRPCPGYLVIVRPKLAVPPRIEWRCSECGDAGVITGWQESVFDLRPEPDFDRPLLSVDVTDEEHRLLRELVILEKGATHMVWGAFRDEQDQLWMAGDEADLEDLSGSVAFEANHTENRRRQRVLDVVFGKLELHLMVVRE